MGTSVQERADGLAGNAAILTTSRGRDRTQFEITSDNYNSEAVRSKWGNKGVVIEAYTPDFFASEVDFKPREGY